ncbi:SH3 domain-containing protein [Limibacillus halophilus]|jgi:SH3-like domain-containing protein
MTAARKAVFSLAPRTLHLGALLFSALLFLALPAATAAWAQESGAQQGGAREVERPGRTGLPLPRFVSLASDEVNLRAGPGSQYPIEWVYRRRSMPVEVIDEFDTWRRIRDWEGTVGWVHGSLLSGRRTLRVLGESGELISLHRDPDEGSPLVAQVEAGVVGDLERCSGGWCQANLGGFEGWLRRQDFYGTLPKETLE